MTLRSTRAFRLRFLYFCLPFTFLISSHPLHADDFGYPAFSIGENFLIGEDTWVTKLDGSGCDLRLQASAEFLSQKLLPKSQPDLLQFAYHSSFPNRPGECTEGTRFEINIVAADTLREQSINYRNFLTQYQSILAGGETLQEWAGLRVGQALFLSTWVWADVIEATQNQNRRFLPGYLCRLREDERLTVIGFLPQWSKVILKAESFPEAQDSWCPERFTTIVTVRGPAAALQPCVKF